MFWIFLAFLACSSPIVPDVAYPEAGVVIFDTPSLIEVVSFRSNPTMKGDWLQGEVPTVFVCRGAPITRTRVYQAMRAWQRLGYELDGPTMNSTLPVCRGEQDFSWGNIVFDLRGQSFPEDKIAVTKAFRRIEDDTIVGAVIELQQTAAEKERTIEHEIGHALGWQHFNRRGHLMNSVHQHGGWDTYGLRRPRR